MTNPQTEFDTPWKDILQYYFEEFILFFFPEAHREIDWTHTPEFLDKELQQVVRDAELGRRLADKLVKIYLIDGQEAWGTRLSARRCDQSISVYRLDHEPTTRIRARVLARNNSVRRGKTYAIHHQRGKNRN